MTTNTTKTELSQVTYVTCFVHIYKEEPFQHKTVDWRIQQFRYVADKGLHIMLYGDETTTPYLEECVADYPNVKLVTMDIPYTETPIYKACLDPILTLPERRNVKKDTVEYMALMNAKIEFMYDAMQKDPWGSKIFAWMDFSMAYIFANKQFTLHQLRQMTAAPFKTPFLTIPGCWPRIPPNHVQTIANSIHWRFCGTFFMGDKQSMMEFHRIYREAYPQFIAMYRKLIWEVNIWAWLEANANVQIQWYESDHNDRMIHIPDYIYREPGPPPSPEPATEYDEIS
jgi:Bacterial protein of unknown function (HtrL_YibB)